eukprot:scaffold4591_cov35-Phaeocystis_antarctica.AAC.3
MFMRWLLIASNLSRTLRRGGMDSREARATIVSSTRPLSFSACVCCCRRIAAGAVTRPSGPGIGIPLILGSSLIMRSCTSCTSIKRRPETGSPCLTPEVFGNGPPSWPLSLTRVSAPLYRARTAFMMSVGKLNACRTSIIKACCSLSKAFALSIMRIMPPSSHFGLVVDVMGGLPH